MNILYVLEYSNKEIEKKDNIYILDINNAKIYHYINKEKIELKCQIKHMDIKLGESFLKGYRAMLVLKEILSLIEINRVELYCSYLNAYFIVQYLLYSGCINKQVEIINKECYRNRIEENIYKFPYYWINILEEECLQLLEIKKVGYSCKEYPLLSIIITYYNLGEYIKETLESIEKCNYPNYEIIIVNDGSTDESSLKVLTEIARDRKIKIINQENKGLSAARNTGALMAEGEYITFLDADDMIDINYYTQCIHVLTEHQEIDLVYSWVEFFEGKDEVWPTFNLRFPYLLLSNMAAAFYVVKRGKFIQFGLNKEEMKQGMEDYDSLISMYKNGCKGVAIPEPLSKYRYRFNSMSKGFKPDIVVSIYNQIVDGHKELYQQYSEELIKLVNTNGPGYLWNNPTLNYPSVALNVNEDINDVKYLLLKLLNTRIGKLGIKILKRYKMNKEIR